MQNKISAIGRTLGVAAILASAAVGTAQADAIVVSSYAYGAASDGDYNTAYQDPNNTKLTDGGVGSAYVLDGTWDGWYADFVNPAVDPEITFNFGSPYTVTDVRLNLLREDNAATELPLSVTIGGVTFPTTNFSTDNTEGVVDYTGSWTTDDTSHGRFEAGLPSGAWIHNRADEVGRSAPGAEPLRS